MKNSGGQAGQGGQAGHGKCMRRAIKPRIQCHVSRCRHKIERVGLYDTPEKFGKYVRPLLDAASMHLCKPHCGTRNLNKKPVSSSAIINCGQNRQTKDSQSVLFRVLTRAASLETIGKLPRLTYSSSAWSASDHTRQQMHRDATIISLSLSQIRRH